MYISVCVCAWSHIIYIINIYIYTARQHLSKRLHWSKASFTGPIFPKQPCFWKVRSCMVAATGGISKEFSSWWHLPIHIAPGSNFLTLKSWRLKSSQQPKKTDQSGCYNTGGAQVNKSDWFCLNFLALSFGRDWRWPIKLQLVSTKMRGIPPQKKKHWYRFYARFHIWISTGWFGSFFFGSCRTESNRASLSRLQLRKG